MKKLMFLLSCLCFAACAEDPVEKEVTVSLQVPDAAYEISIQSIYHMEEELWVIAEVKRDPMMMGVMMITTVTTSVKAKLPELPHKTYVLGKTWNWDNEEKVTFLQNLDDLPRPLAEGRKVYPMP